MSNSDEERPNLPPELLSTFAGVQTAIAEQRYREALALLLEGLDQKYNPAAINPLDLLKYLRGLLSILEFNLRRADRMDRQAGIPKIPVKDTRCSFCGRTYAEVSKLITGTEGIICDECIGTCNEILADDEEESKSHQIET